MPNTYSQIYIQVVFTVRGRQCLIQKQHRERLHKYITGIVQERDHKMLAVFCMPDHVHFLAGIRPRMAISDLVREVRTATSSLINAEQLSLTRFSWQDGFGAFSYSRDQIDTVVRYILNQEEHHRTKSFREEYLNLLEEFEIPFEEKYLFDWVLDEPIR